MGKLTKGVNDLATINPTLAKQWHPTKNGSLNPEEIAANSNKPAWWLGECGHEWPAKIYSRNNGRGCPYCSNVKVLPGFNDLATKNPELISEWDWGKNIQMQPSEVMAGSHQHVWWKCSRCGNEWFSEVQARSRLGQGCPKCAREEKGDIFRKHLLLNGRKSLAEEYPEIAKEWHPSKNTPKTPSDYTSFSSERVWWKCSVCNYEWPTSINNRVSKKTNCPYCAGNVIISGKNDLQTKNPTLAAEWHPTKNLPLLPNEIAPFSKENVWWLCKFGHEYKCRVADRQKGVGCSECSKRFRTSFPEKIVEYYIKQSYPSLISNYRPCFLNGSEIDIYIPELATGIEYDGQRYHQKTERDVLKDRLCHENGICLIRIREPKCPVLDRDDPTFFINKQNDTNFSKVILEVLEALGSSGIRVDVALDKQKIFAEYRNTSISGSIAELYPELAEEWHPTLNGELKPENIPATKSHDRYFWKCKVCGYSWQAVLYERISGTGCPACAGKVIVPGQNDLATTHPLLAKEWHPEKNGTLTPQDVSKGCDICVWWKCLKCGYEWTAKIKKRVAGSGCEQCARKNRQTAQYKTVYQFSKTGDYIKSYPSARQAAEELGISRVTIQHVCTGCGRLKTAGGFCWSYNRSGIIEEKDRANQSNKHTSKKVHQYSTDGIFIKEYDNAKEAALAVEVSQESVRQACNGTAGRKTAGGYIWRYKKNQTV